MVLEEERRREGIDSMILEAVTGPPEQVAPCIRNALEVSERVKPARTPPTTIKTIVAPS
jgi:hypothetical protein